ncbi:MAG: hypothetical protein RQ756_08720, partial [Flavobacteriaceae bacterium]|nr:hypothetical protein [Flavobacteriaceae bacterium]
MEHLEACKGWQTIEIKDYEMCYNDKDITISLTADVFLSVDSDDFQYFSKIYYKVYCFKNLKIESATELDYVSGEVVSLPKKDLDHLFNRLEFEIDE